MDPIELSSYAGLIAITLLTLNILLGLLLSIHYQPLKHWPRKKIDIFKIHNWTGYIALVFSLFHPIIILFSSTAHFHLIDIIFPLRSPSQPTENTIGAVALYLLIVVVVTSYFRGKLGFRLWKRFHYVAYVSAAAFFLHGLLTDPNLKNAPFDPFDAEKVLVEICLLLVGGGIFIRIRYGYRKRAQSKTIEPKKLFHPLRVVKIEKESTESASLYFEIPKELTEVFQHKPGQYVTLRTLIGGKKIPRSYSFSSSPDIDSFHRVTVKKTPSGLVSPYLVEQLLAGETIEVYPPMGRFTPSLDPENKKHYVLIGGGSGITPLLSILKSVLTRESQSQVTLLYGNRSQDQIIFFSELESLAKSFAGRFRTIHILSEPSSDWSGGSGLLNRSKLLELLSEYLFLHQASPPSNPAQDGLEFFICGPGLMMEQAKVALIDDLKISSERVHLEFFQKPELEPELVSAVDSGATHKYEARAPEASLIPHSIEVIIHQEHHPVQIKPGETILEGVLRVGLDAPYACQSGICSTCRAKLISGQVHMGLHDGLTESEVEEGYVLTCQAKPLSEKVTVNYDL